MALTNISRRGTGLLLRHLRRPSPRPPPLVFSYSALHSGAAVAYLPLKFQSHYSPISDLSDSEPEFHRLISSRADPELCDLLQLVSKARSNSKASEEALVILKSSCEIEPTWDLICGAIWELRKDWESAVLVFRWAGDCAWNCPAAGKLMLWVLGKQRRFDLAWSFVRKMHKKSLLTKETMIVLMERYAAANEANKAIKTFDAMEKFRIEADSTVFYALLQALCKHKNVEEAEELLLQKRKFFPLKAEGFNVILDCWCNVIVDVAEAKRIWKEMSNFCVTPDGTSYSHLISCFSKAGNLFDSVRLYDEMKKRGWTPGIGTYNSLVYVLTKENCLEEARNIFGKIVEVGLEPDVRTFNSMIYPLCEANRLQEAREMMDNMVQKGIVPNYESYHVLMMAEDLEGTLNLLNSMRHAGYRPNRRTFRLAIDKFIKLNECGNALRIWFEMRRFDITPDSSHYIAMVQGLAKHGWIAKAMELYNEMKSKGLLGDPRIEKIFKSFTLKNRDHWHRGGRETLHNHSLEPQRFR